MKILLTLFATLTICFFINANNFLDTSFGSNGIVVTDFGQDSGTSNN